MATEQVDPKNIRIKGWSGTLAEQMVCPECRAIGSGPYFGSCGCRCSCAKRPATVQDFTSRGYEVETSDFPSQPQRKEQGHG